MNGINQYIVSNWTVLYDPLTWLNTSSLTVATTTTQNSFAVFTAGAPTDILPLYNQQAATTDTKVFFKLSKNDVYLNNNGSGDGWMRITYFRVRKDIPTSIFADWGTLLVDQTINLSQWATPITTSTTACSYLKWIKTKLVRIRPGESRHYKVKKRWGAQPVTGEYWAHNRFLATKGTPGIFMKWIPAPRAGMSAIGTASTPPASALMVMPEPFMISIHAQTYNSAYSMGDENPDTSYVSVNPSAQAAYWGHINIPDIYHAGFTANDF